MIRTAAALLLAALSIPAAATSTIFDTTLTGPNESPVNASPGIGFSLVTYDDVAHTLRVQAIFGQLTTPTTASHIHCCTLPTAGVATQVPSFAGFPLGVTAGSMDNTFNLTLAASWNPAFITANGGTPGGAEAALSVGLFAGNAYLNIHTTQFPGGEIRGFLHAVPVPEPSTYAFFAAGLLTVVFVARRRRKMG
jgi:hypothetical protein